MLEGFFPGSKEAISGNTILHSTVTYQLWIPGNYCFRERASADLENH